MMLSYKDMRITALIVFLSGLIICLIVLLKQENSISYLYSTPAFATAAFFYVVSIFEKRDVLRQKQGDNLENTTSDTEK